MTVLRWLDMIVLALTLPVFLLAGWPLAGWGAAAGAWVVQRGIQVWATRKATASQDPRVLVGILTGSMIGRGWLVALTIFAVGTGVSSQAGLAAAVLSIALFTVYFTVNMILRPFEAERSS